MKERTKEERKLLNHSFPDLYKHHSAEGERLRPELNLNSEVVSLQSHESVTKCFSVH